MMTVQQLRALVEAGVLTWMGNIINPLWTHDMVREYIRRTADIEEVTE